jgi:hypothetical protein
MQAHPKLPIGTQVMLQPRDKSGVVKKIVESEGKTRYLVAHADGTEATYTRQDLKIRKQIQAGAVGPMRSQAELFSQLIPDTLAYKCVIGSQAYGLSTEQSDVDYRGVFIAPPELVWSLQGAPDHLELGENEEVYWELSHFCVMGLKANPNILECLHTPLVEYVSEIGQELLDLRQAFVSRLVHTTYNGYVMSQFKKIEQDIRNAGAPKWKHVMHLLRLLLSGTSLVREGTVVVDVTQHREHLLAVRRGEVSWDDAEAWRLQLQKEFDDALETSPLPELPDYERVEQFVINIRRRGVLA